MPRAEKQFINNSRHFRLLKIYFSVKQKLLSIGIHIIVILLIITRGYIVHPFLVLEIPLHGLLDTLLKLERWLPTQFLGAPDKPCGVGRADANPKLLLNDT